MLGESEAKFKALVQNTNGIIAILESDSRVRYASPAITSMLGQDQENSKGKFFWSEVLNVNEDDADKLQDDHKELPLELRVKHLMVLLKNSRCSSRII